MKIGKYEFGADTIFYVSKDGQPVAMNAGKDILELQVPVGPAKELQIEEEKCLLWSKEVASSLTYEEKARLLSKEAFNNDSINKVQV